MSNRTIKHEIKLPKSVIVLLVMMVIGLFANAFPSASIINEAFADTIWLMNIHQQLEIIGDTLSGIAACRM